MKPIPVLLGPTASGKTALALHLARRFPIEILSADAMLVYRGMDIGTAKPSVRERQEVPHHLIDVAEVHEDYDVARFVQEAEDTVQQILDRKRIPLVVGGTGFYVKALQQGLPLTPRVDEVVQQALWIEMEQRGLDALLSDIEQVSPQEALRMQRNPRRVIRALEVYRRTGKFPGEFGYTTPRFEYQQFGLSPAFPELEKRIALRVEQMFQQGLIQEVQGVMAQLDMGTRRPTALQAIGYKEVIEGLDLGHSEKAMQDAITLATRQYAKRQLTWLKTQLKVECQPLPEMEKRLEVYLENWV